VIDELDGRKFTFIGLSTTRDRSRREDVVALGADTVLAAAAATRQRGGCRVLRKLAAAQAADGVAVMAAAGCGRAGGPG